jgi:AbrB family looped-hinge helix DNA binding protein
VVIPKAIRDQLGIQPGDEVVFETDGKDVRVRRREDDAEARRQRIEALRGIWADAPGGLDDLMEERRQEREREERKAARWGVGRPR